MARRTLSREDRRLWGRVERTLDKVAIKAAAPESDPPPPPGPKPPPTFARPAKAVPVRPVQSSERLRAVPRTAPNELEPRRHRRLARERDPIDARIDLHGLGRFQAQDALSAFLIGAHARGLRSVLVITGKGSRGGGVIRASLADWVAQPPLRAIVSGVSPAHRRHGGDGAVYVTLRRG